MMEMFNHYWFMEFAVGVVIAIILGALQHDLRETDLRIRKRFSSRAFSLVGKIFGVIVAFTAAFESTAGIIQLLDDYVGGAKSDSWSLILFPFAMIMMAAVAWAIISLTGIAVSQIKKTGLKSIRRDVIKKRRAEFSRRYAQAPKKFDEPYFTARRRVG